MSDTITLPREAVGKLLKMLEMVEPYADQFTDYSSTAAEWPLNLLPEKVSEAITALRTALAAEPTKREFDHSIGADRFKVVRGIFWWHVKIGDSPTEHGKFRSSEAAQKMADDLLREFRNGAFVQNALAAEPTKPEPVATVGTQSNAAWKGYNGRWSPPGDPIKVVHLLRDLPLGTLLYAAPPEDEALRRENERLRDENRLWKSRCIALVWKGDTDNITAGRLQSAAKEIDAALRREDV